MKAMRIPLFIAFGIAVLGLILGSFLDLNISQTVADSSNVGALVCSAIGPTFGFGGMSLLAGAWVTLGLRKTYPTWARVLFFVLAAGCYGGATYMAGKEYFGVNGLNMPQLKAVGILIGAVTQGGFAALGYFAFRNCDNEKIWILLLIIMAAMAMILLIGALGLLKFIFNRPRFRAINANPGIPFHEWWKPCTNYEEYMNAYGLTREEFQSFPSGHTCAASMFLVTITFVPLINPKLAKFQLPGFILAEIIVIFTACARIFAGAHFLSDVSMGATLGVLFTFIANEIVIRQKVLQPKEEQEA